MERGMVKEESETFKLYEIDNKFVPVSQSITDQGSPIYGNLEKFGDGFIESGSFGFNLNIPKAFPDKKEAIKAAKKKWGNNIKIDEVKLNRQFFLVVNGQSGALAIKESFIKQDSKEPVQDRIKPLAKGEFGSQDPAYAIAAIQAGMKEGNFTEKPISAAEYKAYLKGDIIPLPTTVKFDLIAERESRYKLSDSLPEPDKNIVGKSQIDTEIILSDDFLQAKMGDLDAGRRVVDSVLTEKKIEQIKDLVGDPGDKVIITVPSTSGRNVLGIAMAEKISAEYGGKLKAVRGDDYFNVLHSQEIKNISRFDRIFFKREYEMDEPLGKDIEGKKVILLEDTITTGGTTKDFARELNKRGLKISNVVGLMGDKRFQVDEKTEAKLKSALKDAGIAADTSRLKSLLTRTEAGMLIQRINKEKGLKNEKFRALTSRIRGLYNGSSMKNIRRDKDTGRDNGPERANSSNAKATQKVQNRGSLRGYNQGR